MMHIICRGLHSLFIMPVKIYSAELYVFSYFLQQTTFYCLENLFHFLIQMSLGFFFFVFAFSTLKNKGSNVNDECRSSLPLALVWRTSLVSLSLAPSPRTPL